MVSVEVPETTVTAGRSRWLEDWRPEDPAFWESKGKKIAFRNLVFSVFAEHVGFSVWSLFSVMVLFMGKAYGFSASDKFLIVSIATLVGALLRLPYTLVVAYFGGRTWTMISAVLLLIPTILLAIYMHPGTSLTTFVILAAVAGLGGGNFASSMANINSFYPRAQKGWALGLNAGGGNLGVAAVQLVGLLVLSTVGVLHPKVVLWVYLPLIVIAGICAALFMDNVHGRSGDLSAMGEAAKHPQTWLISLLYIGTFGSFIGYSFAFGLVLQNQFHQTPLQAASVTFLGPLLGSFSRPIGGKLSDLIGGARVTVAVFLTMALSTLVVIMASADKSLPLFVTGFVLLFVLSGIGNGSTYKMIPSVIHVHHGAIGDAATTESVQRAERLSGAVIGIAGAIGALGGLFVNLAFRASFASSAHSGVPAFVGILAFYGVCMLLTWALYVRPGTIK